MRCCGADAWRRLPVSGRTPTRGTFAPVWIALLALVGAGTAWAHQDPPGCSGTGVAITFEVFRADGVTPVDLTQSVTECETIVYSVSLAPSGTGSGTPCAFEGGTITITTPDGMPHDVTPSGGVPCIGGTIAGGCDATSVTSDPVTFQNSGTADLVASASYTALKAHTHDMDEADVPHADTALTNTVQACAADTVCTDNFCDPNLLDPNHVRKGLCSFTNLDGKACNDGDACTTNDACSGGTCVGGAAPNCDDGNVCTTDGCNPATGCTHTNNTNPCDDGNPCTTGDACSGGACVGGSAKNCDDGSKCTVDTCDPTVAGGCLHTGVDCDDHNLCTTDTCNPSTGCVNTDISSSCNDGIACTLDSCDPTTGCVNTDNCPNIDCKVQGSGICHHDTGLCTYTNSPDNTPCQDTDGDSCTTPACVNGCCNQTASTNTTNCPVTNCSILYPFSSTNPRTNVGFNESEVLRTFSPVGGVLATPGLTIKLWYNDEHAMFLGVNKVTVKTSSGTTTTNYTVSPLCATPASGCAVTPPQVGTSALDGDQAGTDTSSCTSFPDLCDRPLYPALCVTDTTETSAPSCLSDRFHSALR